MTQGAVCEVRTVEMITCPFCLREQPVGKYRTYVKPVQGEFAQILECRCCRRAFAMPPDAEPTSANGLTGKPL